MNWKAEYEFFMAPCCKCKQGSVWLKLLAGEADLKTNLFRMAVL